MFDNCRCLLPCGLAFVGSLSDFQATCAAASLLTHLLRNLIYSFWSSIHATYRFVLSKLHLIYMVFWNVVIYRSVFNNCPPPESPERHYKAFHPSLSTSSWRRASCKGLTFTIPNCTYFLLLIFCIQTVNLVNFVAKVQNLLSKRPVIFPTNNQCVPALSPGS